MSDLATAYAKVREQGGFAALTGRTIVRLTGADRVRYLNGQVTANVTRLSEGNSAPGCVTTAKGKLSAEVMITAQRDALLVDAEAELRETLPVRLERYIIADDVTLADESDAWCLFHVIHATVDGTTFPECVAARSNRFGMPGTDLLTSRETRDAVVARLQRELEFISPDLAEVIRIEQGVPRWGRELDENTLPPEAGLERTHIDYHKGCYIGQEVISRLKSVGHVNRALTGFVPLLPDQELRRGMRLFSPAQPDRQLGVVTSAAWSFALAKPIALGYLRRGSPQDELIALPPDGDVPQTRLATHPLPFNP